MSEKTLSASTNANLANDIIGKALADVTPEKPTSVDIKLPSDNLVNLPGGYVLPSGEVVKTAEVRELNGFDEEAIAKANTLGRILNTVVSRAVVKIGDEKATEEILDNLLAGDRDALLVGVYSVTFGNPAELSAYCSGCLDYITVGIDLDTEIETKNLSDPIEGRKFTIKGRKNEYLVRLPDGRCQKELNSNLDKTVAELGTILLENTVDEIDGVVVYDKTAIKNIGLMDRREIIKEITKRNPGPQFKEVTVTCPTCDTEVVAPINLGVLFRV